MSRFFMIMLHYLKRISREYKDIAILLAIPIGLIVINSLIFGDFEADVGISFDGYNVLTSIMAPAFLLSFQFFNSFFMFIFLYADLRGGMRWRLLAAPCPVRAFFFPAFIANWLVSTALGVVYIVVTAVFMNVYWGNLFVLAAVLAIISLLATIVAVLIFLFTHKLAQANTIGYIVAFGLMVLSGFMVPLQLFGDNAIVRFLTTHGTPLSLGTSAIISSGGLPGLFDGFEGNIALPGFSLGGDMEQSLINIGILAVITLVLGLVAVIVARRRTI